MKNLIIAIFCLFATMNYAQTNRFVYELKYRENPQSEYKTDLMALDINPKNVKFYDYQFTVADSLNHAHPDRTTRYSTKTDQPIIRPLNSNKNEWYRVFVDYFVIKSNDEMK